MSIKMRMRRLATLAVVSLGVLGVWGSTPSAQAQIYFDPTGTGTPFGMGVTFEFGAFDFAPGNTLAFNSIPLAAPGSTFFVYSHAALSTFIKGNGGTQSPSTNHEFTFILGFQEELTTLSNNTGSLFNEAATFTSLLNAANFLQIYDDTTPGGDANSLRGTGFHDAGSILVLNATPQGGQTGNFTATDSPTGPPTVQFDQFTSNTPGQDEFLLTDTVSGSGSTNVLASATISAANLNPLYFVNLGSAALPLGGTFTVNFSTEVVAPFASQQPSYRFSRTAGVGNPDLFNTVYVPIPDPFFGGEATGYTLGPVNGVDALVPGDNQSFQFRNDATLPIGVAGPAVVPEPASISMGLTGIGMAALAAIRARRRRPRATVAA